MKLLIITQVLDTNHPILGFFHRWIEEFAKHCTVVHVIALQVGTHNLPDNVHVHSLGKEEGESRLKYLWRFYRLIWSLRHEYDDVFVHMNQIYVILGAPLWRLFGKKIGLWYTHQNVNTSLKLAVKLTDYVFSGSKSSFKIDTPKLNVMGQGIDYELFPFKTQFNISAPKLIAVGRISRVKNIELAIHTLDLLRKENKQTEATLQIVGGPLNEVDKVYYQELIILVNSLGLSDNVIFTGPKNSSEMQEILFKSDIFLHTSLTHSADKTLPEAMSSGLFVVSSSNAYRADLPEICFREPEAKTFSEAVNQFLGMTTNEQILLCRSLREVVINKHSLVKLVDKIINVY